jgi:hypothetical protein
MVPQLRISFMTEQWNSRLNCKLASGSLLEALAQSRSVRCTNSQRHREPAERFSAQGSGWPSPSSASAAPNRTGSNSFAGSLRGARELSREEFRNRLTHLLAEQFPDETVESLVSSRDLEHSFSGNYARGLLRRGSTHVAVS